MAPRKTNFRLLGCMGSKAILKLNLRHCAEKRNCRSMLSAFKNKQTIDVGTGGTGGTCPQDLAINNEVLFKNQIKSLTSAKCTCRLYLKRFCLDIYSTFCVLSNSSLYSWSELVSCTTLNLTLDNVNDDDEVPFLFLENATFF